MSPSHPTKDLIVLSLGILISFLVAALVLWHSLTYFVKFIPLSWESRITDPFLGQFSVTSEQQLDLQQRLDKILVAMDYHDDSPITVTLIESDDINAFATLGGHIFVLTGLLEQLESDIGLDMVLAHEAAHILNRDPIQAAAGILGINLVTALITGNGNFAQTKGLFDASNQLLFLNTSRAQEHDADKAALDALMSIYGSVEGAEELFVLLLDNNTQEIPVILSSHPHPEDRIDYIRQYIKENQFK